MRTYKVDYKTPIVAAFSFAIVVASFIQSCHATKASIASYVVPKESVHLSPEYKPSGRSSINLWVDTTKRIFEASKGFKLADTTDYSKQILENQRKSLSNEEKILDLLVKKEHENKQLKTVNKTLEKKSEITQQEKEEAEAMKALWDVGNILVIIGACIIGLLIIQVTVFWYWVKRLSLKR